jgi:oxygen-independent coproporphyrinogen-3 oxidase
MEDLKLAQKYNVPAPRYTSYPTVPNWLDNISITDWTSEFVGQFKNENKSHGISMYIHLPFCESLCTYCGCNKKITTNHAVEEKYINAVLKEWNLYLRLMNEKPVVKELHLGGGTPTFFSTENLTRLIEGILSGANTAPDAEFSFEGHPNNTTRQHLQTLYDLGFRRVSFGVQDNDPAVQRIINRIQPFENVARVTAWAREVGYRSVNFDLIYGLPLQNINGMEKTISECLALHPDRVAFYSYAHVPWTSRGQRLFDENDLPGPGEKLNLYRTGKNIFLNAGYSDIGMDHFSLPEDDLYTSSRSGSLNRNFMGYTTQKTSMLIGLGVSAISDIGNAYCQNAKSLHDYYRGVADEKLPISKGIFLTETDLVIKHRILDLACKGQASLLNNFDELTETTLAKLHELEADGLITLSKKNVVVSETGKQFVRVICSAFDLYLQQGVSGHDVSRFSRAV